MHADMHTGEMAMPDFIFNMHICQKMSKDNFQLLCVYPLLLFLGGLESSDNVASTKFPSITLSVTDSTTGLMHKKSTNKYTEREFRLKTTKSEVLTILAL